MKVILLLCLTQANEFLYVRQGDIKGIYRIWVSSKVSFGNDDWQLYDLEKDPGELNDLSEEMPSQRQEMIDLWNQYSDEVGVVLPIGGEEI